MYRGGLHEAAFLIVIRSPNLGPHEVALHKSVWTNARI